MIFAATRSVCPVCLRVVEARKRSEKDGIYLDKACPEHGRFSTLIWEGDLPSYLRWNSNNSAIDPPRDARAADRGCPYDCGLCAEHQRKGCCMVLELTRRCNLRCPVCFAAAGESAESDLPLSEIEKQYDYLMAHGGPFNIQLSGGEPTVRDDLPAIIRLGREKGFSFFQLNTNGLRLAAEPEYAAVLREAGLDTVFLQFDALDDAVYETLRGRALLAEKLRCIDNCSEAGLGIVLVPVIARGVNENQVGAILRFALGRMPAVRGVHFQPISYFGRCALERPERPVTIPALLRMIEEQTGGALRASDFSGGGAESPYCSFHASYRLRDDGSLKCLPRRSGDGCCCTCSDDSRLSVAGQWSGSAPAFAADGELEETSALDAFLEQTRLRTFAVSGMVFQDAWNLDLERLQRCHICEVDSAYGMVPFCAYNLTDSAGRALYRR
ncbi:MAG: radical SAM protein [Oscillospiraceae bacterium]|nr:radical SAM protein [Oscillospiraceae bacterium]